MATSEYKILPGVVLTTVCDESMLVATGEARGKVPYVNKINKPGAYFWRMMESGLGINEIAARTSHECGVTEADARKAFLKFAQMLCSAGYIELTQD